MFLDKGSEHARASMSMYAQDEKLKSLIAAYVANLSLAPVVCARVTEDFLASGTLLDGDLTPMQEAGLRKAVAACMSAALRNIQSRGAEALPKGLNARCAIRGRKGWERHVTSRMTQEQCAWYIALRKKAIASQAMNLRRFKAFQESRLGVAL